MQKENILPSLFQIIISSLEAWPLSERRLLLLHQLSTASFTLNLAKSRPLMEKIYDTNQRLLVKKKFFLLFLPPEFMQENPLLHFIQSYKQFSRIKTASTSVLFSLNVSICTSNIYLCQICIKSYAIMVIYENYGNRVIEIT